MSTIGDFKKPKSWLTARKGISIIERANKKEDKLPILLTLKLEGIFLHLYNLPNKGISFIFKRNPRPRIF